MHIKDTSISLKKSALALYPMHKTAQTEFQYVHFSTYGII